MPPMYSRRQFAVSASATALAATAGVFYGSRDAQAVDVDVCNLSIEKQNVASATAPTKILLVIDGEWSLDANVVPEKVVIVPSAKTADSVMGMVEFDHVEVDEVSSHNASGEFTAKLDLRKLTSLREAFPETEGESITKTVNVELLVGARKDGSQIGSASTTETFELTLEHAMASAEVGFDAVGFVELTQ